MVDLPLRKAQALDPNDVASQPTSEGDTARQVLLAVCVATDGHNSVALPLICLLCSGAAGWPGKQHLLLNHGCVAHWPPMLHDWLRYACH